MWINLQPSELAQVIMALTHPTDSTPQDKALAERLIKNETDRMDPTSRAWRDKAWELHEDEGTLEVDDQSDGSALVSVSDDGGAYVMAWVWVSYEDMGLTDHEDENFVCVTCSEEKDGEPHDDEGRCNVCSQDADMEEEKEFGVDKERELAGETEPDTKYMTVDGPIIWPDFNPTHRHKNGNDYEMVCTALMVTDDLKPGELVVVYRNEAGIMWARPKTVFDDGRFTPLGNETEPTY